MAWTKPEVNEGVYLRLNIWGGSGTGKTILLLGLPRVGLVPLERGHLHYRKDFNFVEMEPTSGEKWVFDDLIEQLELLKDPKNHPLIDGKPIESLVIDSISLILGGVDGILYEEQLEKIRRSKRTNKDDTTFKDWGDMKRRYTQLMNLLDRLPLNVGVIGRLKHDEKTGMDFQKGDESTEYIFDFVGELVHNKGQHRTLKVVKDRTKTYKPNSSITKPTFEDVFAPIIDGIKSGGIVLKKDTGGRVIEPTFTSDDMAELKAMKDKVKPTPKPESKPTPEPTPDPEPEPEKPTKPAKKATSKKAKKANAKKEPEKDVPGEIPEGFEAAKLMFKGKEIEAVLPATPGMKRSYFMSIMNDKKKESEASQLFRDHLEKMLNDKRLESNGKDAKGEPTFSVPDENIELMWDMLMDFNPNIEIVRE